MRNVTDDNINIANTPSISIVCAVLVAWDQNMTVAEPISFKVECHSEEHSIKVTASNENSNTLLGLLSSAYNCCVSAVYPL